jgi:hypothetical protein
MLPSVGSFPSVSQEFILIQKLYKKFKSAHEKQHCELMNSLMKLQSHDDCRWLIMGPPRSGSTFHVDPNATSAWNAVLSGSKKWVLYPPGTTPTGVHPSPDGADVAAPVSLMEWFINFYDATKEGKVRVGGGGRDLACFVPRCFI